MLCPPSSTLATAATPIQPDPLTQVIISIVIWRHDLVRAGVGQAAVRQCRGGRQQARLTDAVAKLLQEGVQVVKHAEVIALGMVKQTILLEKEHMIRCHDCNVISCDKTSQKYL